MIVDSHVTAGRTLAIMRERRTYQVRELASLAGISVRTLHHYDEIGLLAPRRRSAAGYRLYDEDDLLRLQQILIGRELGFPLVEIGRSLDDPQFDLKRALATQREQLLGQARRTDAMLRAIDAALGLLAAQSSRDTMNMTEIFDGFAPSKYEDEAKERWGNTEAYKESATRTSRYTAADWARYKAEQAAVYSDAVAAMTAGKRPDDPEVMAIAERLRLLIDHWFYPCSHAMHSGLASMHDADSRFSDNIDRHGKGLSGFLSAAIRANGARERSAP